MTDPKKAVKIEIDPLLHAQVRTAADHYGASIRGTIVRYIREGLQRDTANLQQSRGQ